MIMAQNVTSPEDVYGFKVGAVYKLAEYTQIEDYLSKLDDAVSSSGGLKETLYRERFGTR